MFANGGPLPSVVPGIAYGSLLIPFLILSNFCAAFIAFSRLSSFPIMVMSYLNPELSPVRNLWSSSAAVYPERVWSVWNCCT